MDQFDPNEILNRQFGEEEAALTTAIQDQAKVVQGHRRRLLEHMNQEYQIERKYIEQTPMEDAQRDAKVAQLNQKYELRMAKLDQDLEPHVLELQQQEAAGKSKLAARRMEADQRLRIVQEMMTKGFIPEENRAAVLQEQLQAVGVSVPLSMFKPPKTTPQDQLKAIRAELEYVTAATSPFVPKKDGGEMFNRDGTLRSDVLFVEARGTKGRRLTAAERDEANRLFAYQRQLQSERNDLLGELQVGRLTRAMAVAGNMQSTPFANKVAKQVQQKPVKPTVALVNQLKARGLDRKQAEQWLKENGYDVSS